jgi:hypothetical protein
MSVSCSNAGTVAVDVVHLNGFPPYTVGTGTWVTTPKPAPSLADAAVLATAVAGNPEAEAALKRVLDALDARR